ncbi:hypothetical protein CYMTET_32800 [Cymbomonas tetramitiformis]|uniref:Uncharacterized protein n=1 Tax=Cymbomonas tetramitiformis TaxID=36881 RepID=A0AAE0FEB6_9CHLO|nr:hypothetical protein CYMTET_32800 [Cymbomonas tetramitiformis]
MDEHDGMKIFMVQRESRERILFQAAIRLLSEALGHTADSSDSDSPTRFALKCPRLRKPRAWRCFPREYALTSKSKDDNKKSRTNSERVPRSQGGSRPEGRQTREKNAAENGWRREIRRCSRSGCEGGRHKTGDLATPSCVEGCAARAECRGQPRRPQGRQGGGEARPQAGGALAAQ